MQCNPLVLVDGHTLFDYSVGLNDLIQLLVKAAPQQSSDNKKEKSTDHGSDKENEPETEKENNVEECVDTDDASSVYKVGDLIDARDLAMGAWFESNIKKITKSTSKTIKSEKTSNSLKPVLSETSLTSLDNKIDKNTSETSGKITDENANDKSEKMDIDEPSTSNGKVSGNTAYDKLFDIVKDDGFVYHMVYEGYDEEDHVQLQCKDIRPRAKTIIKFSDVKVGSLVMANYNIEEPDERGFWYDCVITDKIDTRTNKKLTATVYFGPDLSPLENCKLLFVDEIFDIEEPGTQLSAEDLAANPNMSPVKRTNKPDCDHCLDNPRRKCKHCACCVCGGKQEPERQILCDECNKAYHLQCMDPPLDKIPDDDEWYCPSCKLDDSVIVKAGEKLKESKRKSKMPSQQGGSNRDWGRGMACVGRQKTCTVVPANHFGPIPGVEVGTMWKYRVQVSEAGVHRPHVAGIAGRENEGAYSIVLSGGYEDDTDNGDSFFYTGSGGRDLSGNKRTAEQSCDQTLTRMNKALARNCNAPIDAKNGATSKDWRAGKPVRVVRNCKLSKHSDYAPEEGNRYDGIYKIVKYWPQKGQSGFLVWRYLMQRDDPTPAPWTKAGQKRTKELGLTMQYPDGYLEAQAQKEKEKEESDTPNKTKGKGKRKRKDSENESAKENASPTKKSKKIAAYKVSDSQSKLIKKDEENNKLWDEALTFTKEGGQKFLQKVEELFACICCQDLVFKPVTTECRHNVCKSCLQRSFKAEVTCCPACRTDLGKDYKMPVNNTLNDILLNFFPGYDVGR
ncbi:ubiquitin-like with PHD and RING finger domains 2 [Mactra antiquata]